MQNSQRSRAISHNLADDVPPCLLIKETAVWLSDLIRIFILKEERKKHWKAKETAKNSRILMCFSFSKEDQKPKASLLSEVQQPQPDFEASQVTSFEALNG